MLKTSEIAQRNTITELYFTRHKESSVLKLTKYGMKTIHCIVMKLKKRKSVEQKTHNPGSDKKKK